MPRISTHLHLALKLYEKMQMEDKTAFFLGDNYSEIHAWIDEHIKEMELGDITKYDCMICDMPIIGPLIEELRQGTYSGAEEAAMKKILSLETEPIPLYLVPDEKKLRYERILEILVDEAYNAYREKQLDSQEEVLDNEQNVIKN